MHPREVETPMVKAEQETLNNTNMIQRIRNYDRAKNTTYKK